MTIKYIQYYGQRRSGSTWFSGILKSSAAAEVGEKFGLKHGLRFKKNAGNLNESLFIFLYRDVYAWVDSLYRRKEWLPYGKEDMTLSEFIRHPYYDIVDKTYKRWWPHLDLEVGSKVLDFSYGFLEAGELSNLIELRARKLLGWSNIQNQVPFSMEVTYSELISGGKELWKSLLGFGIKLNNRELNIKLGRLKYYSNKEYLDRFSKEDIEFINKQIKKFKTWDIETRISELIV